MYRPSSDPDQPVTSKRLSRAEGVEHLPRARWQSRSNEGQVRLDHAAIAVRVLERQNEANRASVLRCEEVPLAVGGSVLPLEVDEQPLDLGVNDLVDPEEHEIGRLAVRACLPDLIDGGGSVVTVASIAGLEGHAYAASYSASKGGVVALTDRSRESSRDAACGSTAWPRAGWRPRWWTRSVGVPIWMSH
jgi:hypothetical protein